MKRRKVYDSMKQAAAGEGLDQEILHRAKNAGCKAFRGSRVHAAELRSFLSDRGKEIAPEGDGLSLKDQKLSEEVRRLKVRNDREEGKQVLKTDVAAAIRRALSSVAAISESKLVNEYPTAVAGLDVPQARVYGKRLHDSLMSECARLATEFPQ